ncbi:hypothetical protein SAMN05660649_01399 [Desulfotomaculum arcticum]|uniref:Uncharacterized protein n=1 Tax=Desulfotruncus arcticus DSM 17038 TaxID=1121424 RepID=A0A1I2RAV1_9FIRM|nr:hypothetical protein SAMN05660649_01399 [Desulfotomaculum arcticum] [Desulfotruncus arcticus DSM 17038]
MLKDLRDLKQIVNELKDSQSKFPSSYGAEKMLMSKQEFDMLYIYCAKKQTIFF